MKEQEFDRNQIWRYFIESANKFEFDYVEEDDDHYHFFLRDKFGNNHYEAICGKLISSIIVYANTLKYNDETGIMEDYQSCVLCNVFHTVKYGEILFNLLMRKVAKPTVDLEI